MLRPSWLVIARADRLSAAGDFLTAEIAGARVLLARGQDGVIRAFHNVCRHRGMWVAEGNGRTRAFACPYHLWTYDLAGKLVAAPEMERTARFEKRTNGLLPIRCETWQGYVAVNLDGTATSLASELAELEAQIAPWRLGEMVTVHEKAYPITWDWKVMWENAIEGYHTSALHRQSAGNAIPTSLSWVSEELDGRPWSDLHHPFADELPPPPLPDWPSRLPGLPEFIGRELVFFHVWPCLGFYLSPNNITSYIVEPVAPGRHRFVWRVHVPKERTEKPGFAAWRDYMASRIDIIQGEDELACRGFQAGLETGAWTPGRYSDKERAIWHFHRWYAGRMATA
ncbi:MAG: aromatic ring-hydroxylating dioxygenase subunit alpha [Chloroflexi bacterium]|nr:aromatic ring-hydroxylating dioxygenase subunit alpha [Chloroflexota bacterium]